MKLLSVIIVTHNSEKDIYDCLEAIFKFNDIADKLEVIVVDNNSVYFNEMASQLQKLYADKVRIVSNACNGGYGQGNNLGISYASTDIVMVINPDVRLLMPLFSEVIFMFKDSSVAMCGFKLMDKIDKAQESFRFSIVYNGFIRSVVSTLCYLLDIYDYKRMYLLGACFCIRKSVFLAVGQFDEQVFLYGEENDLHFRFRQQFPSMRITYRKDLCCLHPMHDRPYSEKMYRQMYASEIHFLHKNNLSVDWFFRNEIFRLRCSVVLNKMRVLYKFKRINMDKAYLQINLIKLLRVEYRKCGKIVV